MMTIVISLLFEPCHQLPWNPPCLPDGQSYPDQSGFVLFMFILFALVAIGLFLQETFITRGKRARTYTTGDSQEAAERISAALRRLLPGPQGRSLQMSSKSVASDLLVIIDFILYRTTRYCYVDPPEDQDVLFSIYKVRREAVRLRNHLLRTLFFLRFNSQAAKGHRLTLEATEQYVAVLVPLVKELHSKYIDWRENIPLIEIAMPNECEG
jgi:hypothetical protein